MTPIIFGFSPHAIIMFTVTLRSATNQPTTSDFTRFNCKQLPLWIEFYAWTKECTKYLSFELTEMLNRITHYFRQINIDNGPCGYPAGSPFLFRLVGLILSNLNLFKLFSGGPIQLKIRTRFGAETNTLTRVASRVFHVINIFSVYCTELFSNHSLPQYIVFG